MHIAVYAMYVYIAEEEAQMTDKYMCKYQQMLMRVCNVPGMF